MATPDHRLTELEIAVAHQQQVIDDLSDVIRAQAAQIDRNQALLEALVRRLADTDFDMDAPAANVRPPHW